MDYFVILFVAYVRSLELADIYNELTIFCYQKEGDVRSEVIFGVKIISVRDQ